jgi:catechol 2,3-dioxygenase-like lactoylglutathione lyase family enzyme
MKSIPSTVPENPQKGQFNLSLHPLNRLQFADFGNPGPAAMARDLGSIGRTMISSRLRSRPGLLLLSTSLVISLVLGSLFVVAHRLYDPPSPEPLVASLTDDQARAQVLDQARQFVEAGKLGAPSGVYLLSSCTTDEQPPYQGAVRVNFDVPTVAETPVYFRQIARAMEAHGWHEGLPPGRHPGGHTLAKDGLIAVYFRDPDLTGRGLLQISGECRDFADHHDDPSGFVDITGELKG